MQLTAVSAQLSAFENDYIYQFLHLLGEGLKMRETSPLIKGRLRGIGNYP